MRNYAQQNTKRLKVRHNDGLCLIYQRFKGFPPFRKKEVFRQFLGNPTRARARELLSSSIFIVYHGLTIFFHTKSDRRDNIMV